MISELLIFVMLLCTGSYIVGEKHATRTLVRENCKQSMDCKYDKTDSAYDTESMIEAEDWYRENMLNERW